MMRGKHSPNAQKLDKLWQGHASEWRNPVEIASQWQNVKPVDVNLLEYKTTGPWWDILDKTQSTMLVTREYEHLAMAITVWNHKPLMSYMQLPHPSGIAVDMKKKTIHIASTRNPNLLFDFGPVSGVLPRYDINLTEKKAETYLTTLLPKRIRFYPGCFYMHDLAFINGKLHANSVGQNAVIHLGDNGDFERAWWPHCIEKKGDPIFERNHIQLNSIAAGSSIEKSYFSASSDKVSARRPGHKNFPVDRRGVIFSGQTREPVAYGLTRPHSARLYDKHIYVDDSGYGELVIVENPKIQTVTRLPGWTRGLAFHKNIAFVGSSRVIPRFQQYAPGLDVDKSKCGLHAVDLKSGQILASLYWPYGNQIFAIELAPRNMTSGFPMQLGKTDVSEQQKKLFYSFQLER